MAHKGGGFGAKKPTGTGGASVLSVFSGFNAKSPGKGLLWAGYSAKGFFGSFLRSRSVYLGGGCCGSQTRASGKGRPAFQLSVGQRIGDNNSMKTGHYRLNNTGKVFCPRNDFSHGTSQNSRI